ncbi:hypothetical protein PV682_43930 [Streptomyces niveiscabiei]|uniref:hypothetical protein n=1 Tax=Streptomyces niveiscabiei TaxID=164115 RepID=UPI0029BA69F8|nr:hypothetical protein [Streptomyces niveiscabiei]MDX3388337.1 hypothetical protein [Streptomyces niveiscabiei]
MLGRPVSELFTTTDDSLAVDPSAQRQTPIPPHQREADENPLDIAARTRQLTTGNADGATLAFLGSSLEQVTERYE